MSARRLSVFLATAALLSGSTVLAAANPLSYCKSDVARLCPGVQPGGGRIIGCLKEHKMEVSVGCAKTIQKLKAEGGK